MYRIAVCDSNVVDAQELVNKLQHLAADLHFECSVESFRTARAFAEAFKARPFPLVFLETEIGGTNGIELAKRIRFHDKDTEFIFVTSHAEYALAAYAVFPVGYILKSVTKQKLHEPFLRAVRKEKREFPKLLIDTADGGETIVPRDDILYVEVFGNDLVFHCKNDTVEGIGSLSGVMERLPSDQFYRSHRNFIVNLRYVQRIGRFFFVMQNGEKVSVAKNRYTEARGVFERYLSV
ncbi:MAG: response regulator transcription factor [Clostridia bacterium]|nr:response regulator transcription factor [Clostridia bacterium]MBO7170735.1 response regulator transcription factor [Clostridia bacterium]